MCGMNDLYYKDHPTDGEKANAPNQVVTYIEDIIALFPESTVLVSTVPQIDATICATALNCPSNMANEIDELNTLIRARVGNNLCDANVQPWNSNDYRDGIHRTAVGNAKIAASFLNCLPPGDNNNGLSTGAIAGISAGVLGVIIVATAFIRRGKPKVTQYAMMLAYLVIRLHTLAKLD